MFDWLKDIFGAPLPPVGRDPDAILVESMKRMLKEKIEERAMHSARLALETAAEGIEDHNITRTELKKVAGIIQNDHPDLARGLLSLVKTLDRMRGDDE